MIRRTAFALIALAGLVASPASAAPPAHKSTVATAAGAPADADLKCMLVASALGQNADPKAKQLSTLMVFYYLGRVDVRAPGVNLAAALQGSARGATQAEMQANGQRCISVISARGRALQALGGPPPSSSPSAAATPPAGPAAAPAATPQ